MSIESQTIVWFRRDLRIEDNPALASVTMVGCVIPVFIWCLGEEGQFYPGRASRWWRKHSLSDLASSQVSCGDKSHNINAYDPVLLVRDHQVKSEFQAFGCNANFLYESWEISDLIGLAFTTFNEFWSKCLDLPVYLNSPLPSWRLVPASGTSWGA